MNRLRWRRQGMSQLGNIVLFSSVWFTNSEQEQNERYFLLFSEWLIILSADTPYKFIDKLSTRKLQIEAMPLDDEDGDYTNSAITTFIITLDGEFYGSADVHSLKEKEQWCQVQLGKLKQKSKDQENRASVKPPVYAALINAEPWSITLLRPAPPAKMKIENNTCPKLMERLGIKGKNKSNHVLTDHPDPADYSSVLDVIDFYCTVGKMGGW